MSEFLADPGGSRWKDGQFNDKLHKRLGTSYDSYIATIDELRKTTDMFKQRLKLDPDGKQKFKDEANFRKYYKRLDFSLKKADYDDLMSCLRRANSSLNRMTTQTISLEGLQTSENPYRPPMPRFDVIKEHAQGVHYALESGWQCPCHADHGVHLRLEHRMDQIQNEESDEDESVQEPFHVVFRYDHHSLTSNNPIPPTKKPWNWEEVDVQVTIRSEPSPGNPKTLAAGAKGVRFAKQAKTAVQAALGPTRNMQPIQSLCATISTLQPPQREICLSLLVNEYAKKKHSILIYPSKSPPRDTESWSIRDLPSVLTDPRFSRRYRIRLAVTLASSVLQLHQTPWLADNWRNSDILFIERSGNTAYTDPFVLQNAVGENQARAASLPPLMKLIIRNQALYALGIVLIELWFGKPLSEYHKPEDGLSGTGDVQTDLITELATANRLVEELRDDAGGNYADAVRRCLSCDFDCRFKTLDDVAFLKAVFQGVVAQVKDTFDYMFRTRS
ncbi:uncharacterized protein N0V89_009339 [Didymosphaeria variabile]|uniref:DUF7580 domain-containing protein n=1 Tax=Didymosphaeria variabile TaxID=1932322 RepID=A0A9W9C6G5_9PLEO|nr:uncharacterized protein N0V89_009339 [Didymosphaeria variabile]KAJ4347967.1 hypothetical protein N0V89_009339 [Didymosphaeria variabile]